MTPRQRALSTAALLLVLGNDGIANAAEPPPLPRAVAGDATDTKEAKKLKAQRELEALLLQTLVASAFTKDNGRMFGTGAAGRQWQAMMTEHVARAMAASGQIKILPGDRRKAAARLASNPLPSSLARANPQSLPGWVTVATPGSMAAQPRTVASDATQ